MQINITIDIPPEEVSQILGDTTKIAAEVQQQLAANIAKEMSKSTTDFMTNFWKGMSVTDISNRNA